MADEQQYRLPLPIPANENLSELEAANSEREEAKIKLLQDIALSVSSLVDGVKEISSVMKTNVEMLRESAKQDLLEKSERAEKERETPDGKPSVTLKETMEEGKGFWTIITAFFIPAIVGFVSTLTDLTTPLGLLEGAVIGLATFFGSRALLMLIAGGIKVMVAKIGAAIVSQIAASKVSQKIGGLFGGDKGIGGKPSGGSAKTPSAKTPRGGGLKFLSGANLAKGAVGMLAAASAIFVLSEALENFSDLKWETLAMAGTAIIGLAGAAALLGKFSPIILTGAGVLAVLGLALIPLGVALALVSPLMSAFGEVLEAVGGVIDSFANGFVKMLEAVSQLDPVQVFAAAGAITALGFSLVALGAGQLVNGLFSLFSADPIGKLIELGNVAPNIVELSETMANFSNIVEFFNDALGNLDADNAMKQFELIRDGIEMVAEALDEMSMIKLVSLAAVTKISGGTTVQSPVQVSEQQPQQEMQAGVPVRTRTTTNSSFSGKFSERRLAENDPELYNEYLDRKSRIYQEEIQEGTPEVIAAHVAKTRAVEELAPKLSEVGALTDYQQSSSVETRPSVNATPIVSQRSAEMQGWNNTRGLDNWRGVGGGSNVSVSNVNSVNKNETNYKSASLGSALQGDAFRYVY